MLSKLLMFGLLAIILTSFGFIKLRIPYKIRKIEIERYFKCDSEVTDTDNKSEIISTKILDVNNSSLPIHARQPPQITIRNAKFHDLTSIINLRLHVFYPSFVQNYEFQKKLLKKVRERFDKGSTCLIVTAFNNGNRTTSTTATAVTMPFTGSTFLPIGTLEFNSFDFNGTSMESVGASRKLYIADLAIRTEYRRYGIATSLLQAVESYALNLMYEEIYLHVEYENKIALQLYFRNGYIIYPSTKQSIEFTESHLANSSDSYVMLYKKVF